MLGGRGAAGFEVGVSGFLGLTEVLDGFYKASSGL